VAAGVTATHRDQDILGTQPPMELTRFDKRMRGVVVLLVVFAVAVFSDDPHSLDRPLGTRKEE